MTQDAHDPRDGPNREAERLERIASAIEKEFGGKGRIGFFVMVYPFDLPPGETIGNYISNTDRGDVIKVLENRLARLKALQIGEAMPAGRA